MALEFTAIDLINYIREQTDGYEYHDPEFILTDNECLKLVSKYVDQFTRR